MWTLSWWLSWYQNWWYGLRIPLGIINVTVSEIFPAVLEWATFPSIEPCCYIATSLHTGHVPSLPWTLDRIITFWHFYNKIAASLKICVCSGRNKEIKNETEWESDESFWFSPQGWSQTCSTFGYVHSKHTPCAQLLGKWVFWPYHHFYLQAV